MSHQPVHIEPQEIVPDDRDWTYVITEGCEECGFLPFPASEAGMHIRRVLPPFRDALSHPDASLRPAPTIWSPLEYACHVRDVCSLSRTRLELMLSEDDPEFQNWDQDATAVASDYYHQDPAQTGEALAIEIEATASAFDRIRSDEWARTGRRSNGSLFSVETFVIYVVHDLTHHLVDIQRDAARGSR